MSRDVGAVGRRFLMFVSGASALAWWCLAVAPALGGDEHRHETREERQMEGAVEMREAARSRAESQLGYEDVYGGAYARYIDFYALNQQIARLSALLETMKAAPGLGTGAPFLPTPPAGWRSTGGGAQADVAAIYGPDGPTAKSVRLLLEYRLLVTGNPRLVVGEVSEDRDFIRAQVATTGGALVEEYAINKVSGIWTPVR